MKKFDALFTARRMSVISRIPLTKGLASTYPYPKNVDIIASEEQKKKLIQNNTRCIGLIRGSVLHIKNIEA